MNIAELEKMTVLELRKLAKEKKVKLGAGIDKAGIVKKIFDAASEVCEKLLSEHADQLKALAEYLLEHETMEADEFNYYFEHGEFMPEEVRAAREVKHDPTIERPAKHIKMTDGYAEEAQAEEAPAAEESGEEKQEKE